MRLAAGRCEDLLRASDHGVLTTLHPDRGVDAVPTCFVVDPAARAVAIPIDRVKPKSSVDLQRTRNLDHDPRAALLCEHWDRSEWSTLWWVRTSMVRAAVDPDGRAEFESLLRLKYSQYEDHAFADLLAFRITEIVGWSASPV